MDTLPSTIIQHICEYGSTYKKQNKTYLVKF